MIPGWKIPDLGFELPGLGLPCAEGMRGQGQSQVQVWILKHIPLAKSPGSIPEPQEGRANSSPSPLTIHLGT